MKEMLKWIDQQSQQSMLADMTMADAVDRKATAFLNLLLTGGTGAMAWGFSIWKEAGQLPALVATLAASAWLYLVAALLLAKVLCTADFHGPGYDAQPAADNLFKIEADENQWMRWMMDHRQAAIDCNRRRSQSVGRWLNRCQWMATGVPIIVISAWALAVY